MRPSLRDLAKTLYEHRYDIRCLDNEVPDRMASRDKRMFKAGKGGAGQPAFDSGNVLSFRDDQLCPWLDNLRSDPAANRQDDGGPTAIRDKGFSNGPVND